MVSYYGRGEAGRGVGGVEVTVDVDVNGGFGGKGGWAVWIDIKFELDSFSFRGLVDFDWLIKLIPNLFPHT